LQLVIVVREAATALPIQTPSLDAMAKAQGKMNSVDPETAA